MRTRWMAVGAAAIMMLAACNDAEPTPDPALAFCDSLDALAESIATVEQLDAQSTVDEAQADVEAVEEAAANVREAAGDLAESQVDAIESAADDLRGYRESLDGSETIEEVITGLGEQIAALKQARLEAGTVHCGLVEAQAAASAATEQVEAAASAATEQVEAAASAAAAVVASMVPEPAASAE